VAQTDDDPGLANREHLGVGCHVHGREARQVNHFRRIGMGLAVASLVIGSAGPAAAADNGTVGASVGASSPCVLVSGSFSYGVHVLSTNAAASSSSVTTGPSITNCSGTNISIFAHVSNFTGGTATWTPIQAANPCTIGIDKFDLNVSSVGTGGSAADLTGTDQFLGSLSNATPFNWASVFTMPCTGSAGGGGTMSGTILVTATF
jgi:hypothetical protein